MRKLRRVHLYLGLALAPLLIFFSLSGAWQSLNLHKDRKDGSYKAPAVLAELSRVHTRQRLNLVSRDQIGGRKTQSSEPFRWLALFAGFAVSVLALIGIWMGFRMSKRKWLPIGILCLGTLLPALFVYLGGGL